MSGAGVRPDRCLDGRCRLAQSCSGAHRVTSGVMNKSVISIALCFLLAACDRGDTSKKSEADKIIDEDTALLRDPTRAEPELERRLMASVQTENGIVIVRPVTSAIETHFLPTTTPWVLTCGMSGISISFGRSASGDGSSAVYLSFGSADQETCAVIGPRLAGRLKTLLQPDH
jgi:hypothetical protein